MRVRFYALLILCLLANAIPAGAVSVVEFPGICFLAGQPPQNHQTDAQLPDWLIKPLYLKMVVGALKQYPSLRVNLVGNADINECSGVECKELSKRRADAIATWLIAGGIDATRINEVSGVGASDPQDYEESEVQRSHNRCVWVTQSYAN